jgi:hypothetical protein
VDCLACHDTSGKYATAAGGAGLPDPAFDLGEVARHVGRLQRGNCGTYHFSTAAVTAMSGVLLLSHFGLLDLGLIFVNPTWLAPAIVGGAILGVGFILGGYCPGTGARAALIGRIDALFFVGGGVLGVFAFAEAYPLYENVTVLRGGLAEFQRVLLGAVPVTPSGERWDEEAAAFREKARADMFDQIAAGRNEEQGRAWTRQDQEDRRGLPAPSSPAHGRARCRATFAV